jgi:hypothetical protein
MGTVSQRGGKMNDKPKCDHTKVVLRRKYNNVSYTDSWHCDDCEEEFFNLNLNQGKITIMPIEPNATIRDQFAMAALTGLLADPGVIVKGTAELSYKIADEMLENQKK